MRRSEYPGENKMAAAAIVAKSAGGEMAAGFPVE